MRKKISINQNVTTILIILLFSFGFFVNFFYGSLGVFPIDTFLHYDSGYRILNGEYPIKDFWIVSGLFVDFFAALLFKIFGVNWYTHIAHSSLLNGLITILTFYFLTKMNLGAKFAFFYSVFFSILAYPPSGTPFVDHHATFLSLAGLYFFILGVKYQTNLYWYVFPWFLGSAFLCKQVPVTYLMILIIPIFLSFCIIRKNFNPIFKSIISSIIFCLIFLLFLTLANIDLNLFLKQYIFYPRSFGSARYDDFYLNLNTFFNNYKFILIVYLGIIIVNYKLFLKDKKFLKSGSFFYFLIISSLVFSLIFHQVFTKNQIYIYFLIPLLCGVFHSYIINSKFKFQKNLIIILIIIFMI